MAVPTHISVVPSNTDTTTAYPPHTPPYLTDDDYEFLAAVLDDQIARIEHFIKDISDAGELAREQQNLNRLTGIAHKLHAITRPRTSLWTTIHIHESHYPNLIDAIEAAIDKYLEYIDDMMTDDDLAEHDRHVVHRWREILTCIEAQSPYRR